MNDKQPSAGPARHGQRRADELPSPLTRPGELAERLESMEPALFLDYDGTLTPIVSRPEDALLSARMRHRLEELGRLCTVAIISGRDLADVRQLVDLQPLYYAGSHGFDIEGPGGLRLEHEGGHESEPALDSAEKTLRDALAGVAGCAVERKRFAIAVHYRNVAESEIPEVEEAVEKAHEDHERLRMSGGKKVFELSPDIEWHKGRAVLWLLKALGLDRSDILPIYVGDDVTDEDAFQALGGRGVAVVVGTPDYPTWADYRLDDTDEVSEFLSELTELLNLRELP